MAKKKKKLKEIEGREWAPPWMAWLIDHPLLLLTEAEMVDVDMPSRKRNALIRAGVAYEKETPCPSQFARNLFGHYRGKSVKLDKLFFNASRHYADFTKKELKKIEQEEDEAIADLEKTMHAAIGSGL